VFSPDLEKLFLDNAGALSGADIEAVLVRSRMRAALRNQSAVSPDDIKGALEDFIPPSYPTEIDLQNIVAVLECTSKSLLPKQWRDADRKELIRRANELLEFSRESGEG
jgi:SpoVK/Ycf46/Vps4 family AAA+-type ATPase